ncbi:MAG: DUF2237 domain-containing protein [Cyclobacteriaceae bacterium]|nr:DUF2237 domain-containing protein [Cyclobacteriaceae bacterium]MCH8517091.1 DUF2237 domain-containing protein [Cyclobacteriaceae bacterium]
MDLNVFGEELIVCSNEPKTGYFRDGCCRTDETDYGTHTVCSVVTDDFLQFSKSRGNDLITPKPEWQFPGLKAGDRWCLCANRWKEALEANCAPYVILEATHEKTLQYVNMEDLVSHAFKDD